MKKILALILVIPSILFISTDSLSHRVNVYAVLAHDSIEGEGNFGKGRPCKSCEVIVYAEGGKEISRGKTDEEGKFRIPLPKGSGQNPLRVVLEAGPGHKGEWEIAPHKSEPSAIEGESEKEGRPSHLSSQEARAPLEREIREIVREEVQNGINSLAKEIVSLRETGPNFRDIIGGLGYIVGIAGIFLYIKAKAPTKKE
ncbi:MAG: hypothetical protein ACK4WB_09695 [Desulfatiglandales bacterium]